MLFGIPPIVYAMEASDPVVGAVAVMVKFIVRVVDWYPLMGS